MLTDVKYRLDSLSITVVSDPIINFSINKVINHISSQINSTTIPDGLEQIAIDMVVGEYLYTLRAFGMLDIEQIDFSAAVKKIQEGDTSTEFALSENNTPAGLFDALIAYFRHDTTDFIRYRVLTW